MSRWQPGRSAAQVAPVDAPFSKKDGHRVGDGRKAAKTLTQAVQQAEAARDDARAALDEMRYLAREARDMQLDVRARVRRAVWTVAAVMAVSVGSVFFALARIGAL